MRISFITYFTSEFTSIGITSVCRFLRFHPHSCGIIFTFDEQTENILSNRFKSNSVQIINVFKDDYLASRYSELSRDRNKLEVITSLKPLFIRLSLEGISEGDQLIYFDPDIMHFGETLSLSDKSLFAFKQIGISKSSSEKYGEFNAGLILLRKNEECLSMVRDWEDKCAHWCGLYEHNGLYADQKYLDDFKRDVSFGFAESLQHNLSMRAFTESQNLISLRKTPKDVLVNGSKLSTFHFHGIRISRNRISTGINRFGKIRNKQRIFRYMYLPVLREICSEHFRCYPKGELLMSGVSKYDKSILNLPHRLEKSPAMRLLITLLRMINLTEIPLVFFKLVYDRPRLAP